MWAEYRARDAARYQREYGAPFVQTESSGEEIAVVEGALARLKQAGILLHTRYDTAAFAAHREQVWGSFQVEWSTITPRMQRLLYAINSIAGPCRLAAAGIAYGYAFVSVVGEAVQVGSCVEGTETAIGLEIDEGRADQAARNIGAVDPRGVAKVICGEADDFMRKFLNPVDILYLDAGEYSGKAVYLDIVRSSMRCIHEGTILLAHDSVRFASELKGYLAWVRDSSHCIASVNVVLDALGLEVSMLRG